MNAVSPRMTVMPKYESTLIGALTAAKTSANLVVASTVNGVSLPPKPNDFIDDTMTLDTAAKSWPSAAAACRMG